MNGGSVIDPCGKPEGPPSIIVKSSAAPALLALCVLALVVIVGLVLFVGDARGDELTLGPGGCPVPWSVDWCMMQAPNIEPDSERTTYARAVCKTLKPQPTKRGCIAAMAELNEQMVALEKRRAPAAGARKRIAALPTEPPSKRIGVGYRLAPGARACWGDTTGRCPAWLAELGGGSCCARADLTVIDEALEGLPCDAISSAGGAVSHEWLTRRYKKPQLGILLGWGQELFWRNRDVLACRFTQGLLGGDAYSGIPSHRECYDLAATERKPPNACAVVTPPPPVLCPNHQVDPGETCLSCPQDVGPCPPPVVPPAATTPAEAASWLESLLSGACTGLAGEDVVGRGLCSGLRGVLLTEPLRTATGATFLRWRKLARETSPRAYCVEAGGVARTVEVSGVSGSFAVPAGGTVTEGRCP